MAKHGWVPERVLVSPAVRTRRTWALVAAELPNPPQPDFPETLYLGSPGSLLDELRKTPAAIGSVMLVAHNPAIEDLAHGLAAPTSDTAVLGRLGVKFPTAALARFEFDGDWGDLALGGARLTDFLRPKDLD